MSFGLAQALRGARGTLTSSPAISRRGEGGDVRGELGGGCHGEGIAWMGEEEERDVLIIGQDETPASPGSAALERLKEPV